MAKNSLVANINRRKRLGISRSKESSHISPEAYREMQRGWPKSKAKKKRKAPATKTKSKTARGRR